MTAIT